MLTKPTARIHHVSAAINDSLLESTITRYRSAVELLAKAYFDRQAAAIVVSDGRLGATHVVGKFLELFAEDADISCIRNPCPNAAGFMRQVVGDLGFSTDELDLQDLEGVLELFLTHQRKKNRRTIIALEEFDTHGWWVLDKIRRLIEFEAEHKNGLMLVLSGNSSSSAVLNEPILDVIAAHAGDRIVLAPFNLSETRDFVRRRVESSIAARTDVGDVGEVVEFFAVTLMHELCAGVPDDIYKVCNECLALIEDQPGRIISVDVVKEAAAVTGIAEFEIDAPSDAEETESQAELLPVGRLVIQETREPPREIPLDQEKFILGRDRLCDICIPGLRVSRFHALFTLAEEGLVVADLGSTNGTCVNGKKVDRFTLMDGDVVTIGLARITYVAGSEQPPLTSANGADDALRDEDYEPVSTINYIGDAIKVLQTS